MFILILLLCVFFILSRYTFVKVIYNFVGPKSLEYLHVFWTSFMFIKYKCNRSDCAFLRFCSYFCTFKDDYFNTCLKYDLHLNMLEGLIKKQILCYFRLFFNIYKKMFANFFQAYSFHFISCCIFYYVRIIKVYIILK